LKRPAFEAVWNPRAKYVDRLESTLISIVETRMAASRHAGESYRNGFSARSCQLLDGQEDETKKERKTIFAIGAHSTPVDAGLASTDSNLLKATCWTHSTFGKRRGELRTVKKRNGPGHRLWESEELM
jgi:hypothetical protein